MIKKTPALHKASKELETALTNCNELQNKALELVDSVQNMRMNGFITCTHTTKKSAEGSNNLLLRKQIMTVYENRIHFN